MATLTFRVPDEVATRFAAHAHREGGKSVVLRRLVDEAVGAAQTASANGDALLTWTGVQRAARPTAVPGHAACMPQ